MFRGWSQQGDINRDSMSFVLFFEFTPFETELHLEGEGQNNTIRYLFIRLELNFKKVVVRGMSYCICCLLGSRNIQNPLLK
jgi:hypothetical protein